VRIRQSSKAKNPPKLSLLNSFYFSDLAKCTSLVDRGSGPAGLLRYLGTEKPIQPSNLLQDEDELERAVAPAMMPAARWPSSNSQPLVLLQQAAVNLARSELARGEGIIAVNGPPGTGKTTLLRDVVAGCVLDRALKMAAFDDPKKAFQKTDEEDGWSHFFYTLDRSLKGHEILVASMNNRPVENISKELPAAKEIGRELNYFKEISDAIYGRRKIVGSVDEGDAITVEPIKTWGLIAAVLGNKANCDGFRESFWWGKDRVFYHYLKNVRADRTTARSNWRRAKDRLQALKSDMDAKLGALEEVRRLCLQLAEARDDVAKQDAALQKSRWLLMRLWRIGCRAILRRRIARLERQVDAQQLVPRDRLVDRRLFARGHEVSNVAAPWISDSLHQEREDLFIAALAVHKAFIDVCAHEIFHNLGALMTVFSSGAMQDDRQRKLLGDLWSTLFLVVPVISTTFAAVDRMLGYLPRGSIGWLLVDEAGQAPPQAAVGAIMRAKRSLVVGDPQQIPPVVTLPEQLILEICEFFKVEKDKWAAPRASVQTLADRASNFQAEFRSDQGPRRVGVPLLVHRRCQEPMFGISNRIAYDEQMVRATVERAKGSGALSQSQWFDVDGKATSHWCPAEGELVVTLLKKIAPKGKPVPDLFVITPFRAVADEMKSRLQREKGLLSPGWAKDRVGTIHTFQGREADAVILVLGAPGAPQRGAREWAGATPNILNVAVSRAKQNLYVVGSHRAWSGEGYTSELASSLRITNPDTLLKQSKT
jgi:hypothetical protein